MPLLFDAYVIGVVILTAHVAVAAFTRDRALVEILEDHGLPLPMVALVALIAFWPLAVAWVVAKPLLPSRHSSVKKRLENVPVGEQIDQELLKVAQAAFMGKYLVDQAMRSTDTNVSDLARLTKIPESKIRGQLDDLEPMTFEEAGLYCYAMGLELTFCSAVPLGERGHDTVRASEYSQSSQDESLPVVLNGSSFDVSFDDYEKALQQGDEESVYVRHDLVRAIANEDALSQVIKAEFVSRERPQTETTPNQFPVAAQHENQHGAK